MKKITAVVFLIIFLTAVIASCKVAEISPDDNINKDELAGTSGDDGQTGDEPENPERVMSDLPDMDFQGKVYNALGNDNQTYSQFVNFEIDAESITGELVNDAVYNRNRRIEDQYNVVIKQTLLEDPHTVLNKLIKADEDAYSLAFVRQLYIGAMASSGSFYDIYSLKYLDFEKPWWSKEVNSAISVGNKLFFTTSDFNMMDKNRTYLYIYNKDMVQEYGLGNLYNLVYENKWTVDKMTEMCRAVTKDLDGDGAMSIEDQWGLGMDSPNAFAAFYGSSDNNIITKDAGDYPMLSVNNERTLSSIDKILKLTNDKSMSFYCSDFAGKVAYDVAYASTNLFTEGRLLFTALFTHMLQYVAQSNTTVDYGVLPFPKYDENQKDYITFPDPFASAVFVIPMTVQDIDFASFMLEALSAASKYEVMPYYIETSVKTKYTYDEDSPKMLDIIFNGIRYDLGFVYNWANIGELLKSEIPNSGVNNFVSKYESIENKVVIEIENTVDLFKELK